ncbi:TOTE conflict system archaeo-eukaryotic primase domain-containing protein [Edaphobacter dinghuensis]|uniref:TOTE conflict system primase domain-containing protein n=1 Tax=Edaphobacter dinghuensis TaxID=1560005 RepID=A0A917HQH2_9BACT|nr:hypothetical protein [Edaphobacter dinghuensis]GGG87127.1 hypothetical protein GCM10011585_33940 [Edaphobacter dinghuensis]
MVEHFRVGRETADRYIRLFVNRLAYGMARRLSDGSVIYTLAEYSGPRRPKPMNADVIRMHLDGYVTINLFSTNPKTQRCKWVAIDADFDGAFEALSKLQWELKQDNVQAALEASSRGAHLWVFFEAPVLASEARIYIYNLALRIGVPIVGGGIKQGIEVFPKQDHIDEGGYGNAIRAPLGVQLKTNRRYWFYEADVNPEAQLDYLESLKKVTEAELKTFIRGMKLPEAYRPPEPKPYIAPVSGSGTTEFRILEYVQVNARIRDRRNWVARCPSCAQAGRDRHGDNLKILKSNPLVYKCFAGCRKEDIREAVGRPIPQFNGTRRGSSWRG